MTVSDPVPVPRRATDDPAVVKRAEALWIAHGQRGGDPSAFLLLAAQEVELNRQMLAVRSGRRSAAPTPLRADPGERSWRWPSAS